MKQTSTLFAKPVCFIKNLFEEILSAAPLTKTRVICNLITTQNMRTDIYPNTLVCASDSETGSRGASFNQFQKRRNKYISMLCMLMLFYAGQGFSQTTIAQQDFESIPATPTWTISAGSGNISSAAGSTDSPANQRIRGGLRSWQVNNGTATLDLSSQSISSYNSVKVTVRISSPSVNGTNGSDGGDYVRVFTSLNGAAFAANSATTSDITVVGNTNSRWGYNNTINATTNAGTNLAVAGTPGTNQGTIYSTLVINIPNGTSTVALRLIALNTDINEVWAVDDVTLTGTPAGPTPVISTSGTLAALSTTYGTPSGNTSFDVSGTDITGGILITPPVDYEVCLSSDFSTTIGTNASGLTVSGTGTISATTVFARLRATAVAGSHASANIVCSSSGATNKNVATAASTVSQKGLTITGLTGSTKTYNGLLNASFTGTPAYAGLENSESFTVTGTPTSVFTSANVGTAVPITVSGYTAPSANYTVTQPSLSADIIAAALSVTADDVFKLEGVQLTGGAGSTAFTSSGLQNGETIGSVTITYGPAGDASATPGVYPGEVTPSAATAGTFTASNYNITYHAGTITVQSASTPKCPSATNITPTADQVVCSGLAASQLTATITTTGVVGTPTYSHQWYYNTTNSNTVSGATAVSGATSSTFTPPTTAADAGDRYYFCVGYATDNSCSQTDATQSLASNAVKVTVKASPAVPTGNSAQTFCSASNPTIASLVVSGTAVTWYDAATNGTLLLSSSAVTNGSTYHAQSNDNGCASNTRLAVTVTVTTNPAAPSVTTPQSFCVSGTVGDLVATGANIKWYDASTNGTLLSAGTALVNNSFYHASQTVDGCESTTRSSVQAKLLSAVNYGTMVTTTPGSHLVISQVYGGGGNTGATYNRDFVEIFNPTTSTVSLSTYTVQYASSTGSSWASTGALSGSIAPGKYYLVQMTLTGTNGAALPSPNFTASSAIDMSATNGKVALTSTTTGLSGTCPTANIVDFVGYGSANCFEGTATTVLSNSTSAMRYASGYTDTNNNLSDFAVGTPVARNGSTAANAGEGSATQAICSGVVPNKMTIERASGGTGTFSYQWYSAPGIVSCPSGSDLTGWTSLGTTDGAATSTYVPTTGIALSTTFACLLTPTGTPSCGTPTWASGCRQVTVNPNVTAGTVSGASSLCVNGTSTFTSDGTPGGAWMATALLASVSPAGLVTALAPGNATITYMVNSGCGSPVSASAPLVINALPTITPTINNVSCPGAVNGSITVSVTDGQSPYSYNWSNGATSASTGFVGTGTYTLTVTDANTCSKTASGLVVGTNGTTPTITTQDISFACGSSTVDLNTGVVSTSTGNGEVVDFSNDNFSSSLPSSVVNAAGTYQARVTNNAGCVAMGTIVVSSVTYSAAPVVDGPVCHGSNQVTGTSSEADGTVIHVSSSGLGSIGSTTVSGGFWTLTTSLPSGFTGGDNIGATATASGKCESPSSGSVTVSAAKSAGTITPSSHIFCGTTSHFFTTNGDAGGSWSSSDDGIAIVNASTGEVTGVSQGSVTITYEVNDDCGTPYTATATASVTAPVQYFADTDGDTYGDPANSIMSCTQPAGFVLDDNDCDDTDENINPDATEVCNFTDDDCNNLEDDVTPVTYYSDVDGDNYGDPSSPVEIFCESTDGLVLDDTDCDDGDPLINPGATEVANGEDDNCDGYIDFIPVTWYRDLDGDTFGDPNSTLVAGAQPAGYVADNTDCNDNLASVNPNGTEVCNGLDDDCNNQVDDVDGGTYYSDVDGDTYGDPSSGINVTCTIPPGYVTDNTDCDDGDPLVYPGAIEYCNNVDDDCDLIIDDGVTITWYADSDGDGFGNPAVSQQNCTQPFGYVNDNNDCDDAHASVNPDGVEVCNGLDDDCNGDTDDVPSELYFADVDGDGYGDPSTPTYLTCNIPSNYVQDDGDCDDGDPSVHPGATELCNYMDDDCDGITDNGLQVTYYQDADGDSYGNVAVNVSACSTPFGYVLDNGDCDDTNGAVNPAATEVCNGLDDDCDGNIDNVPATIYYADVDGDTYGDPSAPTQFICTVPTGYVLDNTDCDDGDPLVNPAATEICNQMDDDCDGTTDEGAPLPVAICKNIIVYLNAAGSATITASMVDNGSTASCGILNRTIDVSSFTCSNTGANNVVLTIEDLNHQTSNCTAIVTVLDTIRPVISDCPVSFTAPISCSGNVSWAVPNASDVCGIQSLVPDHAIGSVFPVGTTTVTYTATDVNGNTSTCSFDVTIIELSISTSGTPVSCYGGSNGTASVSVNNAQGVPSYLWNTGAVTSSISGLTVGTYTVTVTDGTCSKTATYVVGSPSQIVANGTVTNVNCFGASTGSVALAPTGGVPGYSYLWSNGMTTSSISSLAAGTYTVTITDLTSCSVTSSFTVTQNTVINTTAVQTNVSCRGLSDASVALTPNGGVSPYSYLWSNGQTTSTLTAVAAGPYTVTISDALGCTIVRNYTITQPAALTVNTIVTNSSCFGQPLGGINAFASGGTSPYTYLWSSGQATQAISGVVAATYTVTATDAHGCTFATSATIGQPTEIFINPTVSQPLCFNNNGTISTAPTGGLGGYTYLWNTGATTSSVTTAAGSYTVTVTDAGGCSKFQSITLTNPSAIVVNLVSQTNLVCNGATNGGASVTASGGTGALTYLWSNGQTTANLVNVGAGTYTVTVMDENNCTQSTSVTLTEPTVVVVTLTPQQVTCFGGNNGSISSSVSGGTPGYTYVWSTGATTTSISGLTAGSYTVTVTDGAGCTKVASTTLTVPVQVTATLTPTNVNCFGAATGSISTTVNTGVSPYTYLWSGGQTTANITGQVTGTYTVTITDSRGCTAVFSATITQQTQIQANATVSNITCNNLNNGSIVTAASGGVSPYTYVWSNGSTATSISGLAAGNYTVTITDALGCTRAFTNTITNPAVLGATVVRTNITCNGANNGTATANVTGGTPPYTYLWSNGQTTQTATGLGVGSAVVTINDANSCGPITRNALISQPTAVTISSTQVNIVCGGSATGSATASASGGPAGSTYTYSWSNGATGATASGLTAGTYTVTATTSINGCTATRTITITENPPINLSLSAVHNTCYGTSLGSITTTASGGAGTLTYLWSNGTTTASLTGLPAGVYTLTVTDANSCTKTATQTITQGAAVNGFITVLTNVTCTGDNNGSLHVAATGGVSPYTYLWSNGQTSQVVTGLTAGTHTVTITDAAGCSYAFQHTLNTPVALTANITKQNVLCFGASTGSVTATVNSGVSPYSYVWSSGQTTSAITSQPAGTYTVTITDSRGCTAVYSATITEPTQLTVNHTVNNISCNNFNDGSITTSVSGGVTPYTYLWSNGSTASSIVNLSAGSYNVTITDANGCTSIVGGTIVNPALLNGGTVTKTNATCNGTATGSATANPTGGTPPYTYVWSNGQTTQGIVNLLAGTYTVTISDSKGCGPVTRTTTILQPVAITINTTQTDVVCGGEATGSATATASNGMAPYTYAWSNGQTTATATSLAAGTYTVTATANNGCTATKTVTITENAAMVVSLTPVSSTCSNTGSISSSVSGSTAPYTYLWSNGATTANISGLAVGTYTVTVTSSLGCTAVQSAVVQADPVQITSFNPPSGNTGTVVNIFGSGFTGVTAVRFNGNNAASFTVVNNNQITATVASGTTQGPIQVVNGTCDSAYSATDFTIQNSLTLNLKVFLQGYYLGGGVMNAALLNQGVAGATASQTDSITVELHDGLSPSTTVYTSKVILMTNGTTTLTLPGALIGNSCYIVIRTRNHVETWSKLPVTLSSVVTYDFTTP